jgi:DNA-binding CsgD family transcriptional regulator/tetratricopeptide (TPR) repeat protein
MVMIAHDTVLVGRSEELAVLSAAHDRATTAEPAFVMVGGEAGIGKSRLIAEFTKGLPAPTLTCVGGCLELGADGLPYAPFVAVMRRLVRGLGAERAALMLPGGGRRGLAHWLPVLGEPENVPDPSFGRARLFEDVLTLIERAAEDRPVVVVLEDLHWADPSSRELLLFLVRNLTQPGVLLIGTYRSTDLVDGHPLAALLTGLTRAARVDLLEPAPLRRADVARLLADRLGRTPDPALTERIHRRSAGNPLFVQALAESGSSAPLPLRDLLLTGFRRLPDDSRQVVRAAAMAGDPVGHALLSAVTGLDDLALEAALRPAVDGRLLFAAEPSGLTKGYGFGHALVRTAVAEDLLPTERIRLHVRCAEALRDDPALVPDGRAAAELAAHWYAAGDPERALCAAWRAADVARTLYAHHERLQLLERVLELWDHVADPAAAIATDLASVLGQAAEVCLAAGEPARGIELATRALESVTGDPERTALLLEIRSKLQHRIGGSGLADLREGAGLLPADPPTVVGGRVLATLANRLLLHSRHEESAARATEALAVGRQVNDATIQAWALLTLSTLADLAGDRDRGAALRDEAAQIMQAAPPAEVAFPLVLNMLAEADVRECTGEHGRALEIAQEGVKAAEHFGLSRDIGAVLLARAGDSLTSLGRWPEARLAYQRALDAEPPPLFRALVLTGLGELDLREGDAASAKETMTVARSLLSDDYGGMVFQFMLVGLQLRVSMALGDLAEADRVLGAALNDPALPDHSQQAWPILIAGAAHRHDQQIRTPGSRPVLNDLRATAARLSVIGPVQEAQRATFEAGLGDLPWDEAVGRWRAMDQPYGLATALYAAAESALKAGDQKGAATRLEEAATLAADLGAKPLQTELDHLATRGRLRGQPTPNPDPLGLTPRETEVLALVAEGRSNRQIAETLFISAKTAGVHVSNILAKLNVTSRTEAAAVAHRLGRISR